MREIKFRAWDKTKQNMIKDYVRGVDQYGELSVVTFHNSAYSDEGCPDLVLMQFTGLNDKNSKEIYEGDIVEEFDSLGGRILHFIEYREDLAGFVACHVDGNKFYTNYSRVDASWLKRKNVIGNVHENPKLLEVK